MKVLIIFYSQTGNTALIARAINKGIEPLVEQCDLKPVKEVKPKNLDKYDLIGLGTPVWMGGFTPNVRIFIEKLPFQNGRHIFSFNTHGIMPELYFPSVLRKLKIKGFTPIGWQDWYGNVHFQIAPKPYFTDGHPDSIDLQEAESFGRKMIDVSRRIQSGYVDQIPQLPDFNLTPQLLVLLEFYQSGHNPHGQLFFNKEKCLYPRCRICEENCLMGYIDLSADPHSYGSKGYACDMWMGCTFCELICPTGAIYCDWDRVLHENMGLADLFGANPLEESYKKAIETGRLRKLVSGEIKGPYYKVYDKRPRFKLSKLNKRY